MILTLSRFSKLLLLLRKLLLWLVVTILIWLVYLGLTIWNFGNQDHAPTPADCAIVLGAAIYDNKPSPVFEERINHAVTLFQQGKVPKMIFTGGKGEGKKFAESEVARTFAFQKGVPNSAMLKETQSRTTRQNLLEAKLVMDKNGFKSAIIVSDPLHMKRAVMMARDIGISAVSSPTPTSRYHSLKTQLSFLVREVYFYNHYLIFKQ